MKITHPISGEMVTAQALADETGIARGTISRRWYKGDRGEHLIRPINPKLATHHQRRRNREAEQAKIEAMVGKLDARQAEILRRTSIWAMLTAPALGAFARHYDKLRSET